jgi:hypothetical protein
LAPAPAASSQADGGEVHVAELNIARPLYPLDDPRMADFVNALDRVNAVAERSEGFVWRLKGAGNDATDLSFEDEPGAIVNMSVWESVDALQRFVWTTIHRRFFDRKPEWFGLAPTRDFVMWWVEPGHLPDLREASERLAHLRREGSTEHAFGWDHVSPKRWLGRVEEPDPRNASG